MSSSLDELESLRELGKISDLITRYFVYTIPWLSLAFSSIAFVSLLLRRYGHQSLLFFLFKWQYAISIVYTLNLLFLDYKFSPLIAAYDLTRYVDATTCAMVNMISKFIYCLPSWLQVVFSIQIVKKNKKL